MEKKFRGKKEQNKGSGVQIRMTRFSPFDRPRSLIVLYIVVMNLINNHAAEPGPLAPDLWSLPGGPVSGLLDIKPSIRINGEKE
jgi:hypothetical protein